MKKKALYLTKQKQGSVVAQISEIIKNLGGEGLIEVRGAEYFELQELQAECERKDKVFADYKQFNREGLDIIFKQRELIKDQQDQLAKYKAALEGYSWMDFHACITGDCPHGVAGGCLENLIREVSAQAKLARAALAEGDGMGDA